MRKIGKAIIIVIKIIPVILVLILVFKYFYDQKVLKDWEQKVEKYLLNEVGYSKEEILSIEGNHNWTKYYGMGGCLEYSVKVRFSDEPRSVYFYCVENDIHQDGSNGTLHQGR